MGNSASLSKVPKAGHGNTKYMEDSCEGNVGEHHSRVDSTLETRLDTTLETRMDTSTTLETMGDGQKQMPSKLDFSNQRDKTKSDVTASNNTASVSFKKPKKTQAKDSTTAEAIAEMETSINYLKRISSFLTKDVDPHMFVLIRKFCGPPEDTNQEVILFGINNGMVDTLLWVFKSLFEEDFLNMTDKFVWFRFRLTLTALWNGSDRNTEFCTRLVEIGAPEYLLGILQDPRINDFIGTEGEDKFDKQLALSKGIFGIIHNILLHTGEASRTVFRDLNAVKIFQKKLSHSCMMLKARSFINLAYLVNEDENEIINADDIHIQHIVGMLKDAVNSPKRRSQTGFAALETVEALNKLAVNDNNKERILNAGALEHYEKLLAEGVTEQEEITIIHGIWTLAFNKLCRVAINTTEQLLPLLKERCNSENEKLKKVAMGAIWVLKGDHTEKDINADDVKSVKHVMISYNWNVKKTALQIRDKLLEAGFKVWMDVDNMTGSTLEAMAEAVENAAVVLLCMTRKYKESPSCRTEAEYTYQLRKPYIPLRLESNYKADGWLGIMVGTKLWFDFIKNFQAASSGLIKEIGERGQLDGQTQLPVLKASNTLNVGSAPKSGAGSSVPGYSLWSQAEVSDWLNNNGLSHYTTTLSDMDGSLLKEFSDMRNSSSDFFFSSLRDDFKFTTIDILKFTKAMNKLN